MARERTGENGAGRRESRIGSLQQAVADGSMLRLRDAARMLGVSEMTVRRDLAAGPPSLTCLGGYVFRTEAQGGGPRYALDAENASHIEAKREAALRAAALIEPHDTVFVDCGTTMPHLAAALPEGPVTVVCYALNIAEIVARRPTAQLVVLGGLYHASSASLFGDGTLEQLRRLGIAKAFISAGGFDFARGVTCSHFHEVPVKQAAMAHALRSYLVADSSKLGLIRPAAFAQLEAFDAVMTDDGLSPADREHLEGLARQRAAAPKAERSPARLARGAESSPTRRRSS